MPISLLALYSLLLAVVEMPTLSLYPHVISTANLNAVMGRADVLVRLLLVWVVDVSRMKKTIHLNLYCCIWRPL